MAYAGREQPTVTVYVVNHNYGRFLEQAVSSVLDQDYPRLEVVVVDDASTDDSADLLATYESDDRIRVIRQTVCSGLTVSSNTAIRSSTGELVMRLDADDYLHPSAVRTMVAALVAEPSAVLAVPDYAEVDTSGAVIRRVRGLAETGRDAITDLPAHGACTMVRRSFLESIGLYDESISCQDGFDLWLNVRGRHVVNVAQALFFYRRHGNNLTCDEGPLLRARGRLMAKHVQKRGLPRPRVLGLVSVPGPLAAPGCRQLDTLGDRSLIDWTVDEALDCAGIDRVVVNSPDVSVLEHVRQRYGSRVVTDRRRRSGAISNGIARQAVHDVLTAESAAGQRYDAVLVLGVESPFRTSMYMCQAIHTAQLFSADVVIGIRREDQAIYRHDGLGLQPLGRDGRHREERETLFRECGGMLLVTVDSSGQPAWPGDLSLRTGHVLLDQLAAFRIGTQFDFEIAQHLAKQAMEQVR